MGPVVIGGNVWRVVRVSPGDPFLIDRTGSRRIATADISTRTIRISEDVEPPLLDRVVIHEISHAIMHEHGIDGLLAYAVDGRSRILAEELMAWFMESHAMQAIAAASSVLGRMACVDGLCAKM